MDHSQNDKYVVYDYSLGTMGFSNEEQLSLFFKKIFEGNTAFYPYTKCIVNKIGEVSDECQQFFNGPAGVQPLEKADPNNKSSERSCWNKQRLELLIKYSNKGLSSDTGKQVILEEFKEKLQTYKNVEDAFRNIDDLDGKINFLKTGQGIITKTFHKDTDSIKALKNMIAQFGEKPDNLYDIVSSIKNHKLNY